MLKSKERRASRVRASGNTSENTSGIEQGRGKGGGGGGGGGGGSREEGTGMVWRGGVGFLVGGLKPSAGNA